MYYLSIYLIIFHTTRPIVSEPSNNLSESNTQAPARPELQNPNQSWNNGSSPIAINKSISVTIKVRQKRSPLGRRLIGQLGITEQEINPEVYMLYPCAFPQVSEECLFFAPRADKEIFRPIMRPGNGHPNITLIKYKDLPDHVQMESKLHNASSHKLPLVIITGVYTKQYTDNAKRYTTYSCILFVVGDKSSYEYSSDYGLPCLLITNQLDNIKGYHDIELEYSKLAQICIGPVADPTYLLSDDMNTRDPKGEPNTFHSNLYSFLDLNGRFDKKGACIHVNPPNCTKEFVLNVKQLNEKMNEILFCNSADNFSDATVVAQVLYRENPWTFRRLNQTFPQYGELGNPFRVLISTLNKHLEMCGRSKEHKHVSKLIDGLRAVYDHQISVDKHEIIWQNSSVSQSNDTKKRIVVFLFHNKQAAMKRWISLLLSWISNSSIYARAVNYHKLRYGLAEEIRDLSLSDILVWMVSGRGLGYTYSELGLYLTKIPTTTIAVFANQLDRCQSNNNRGGHMLKLNSTFIKSFINVVSQIAPDRNHIWNIIMHMGLSSNVLPVIEQKYACSNLTTIDEVANHAVRGMLSSKDPVIFDLITNIIAAIYSFDMCSEYPLIDLTKQFKALGQAAREILDLSSKDDFKTPRNIVDLMKMKANLINIIVELSVTKLNLNNFTVDTAAVYALSDMVTLKLRKCLDIKEFQGLGSGLIKALTEWHQSGIKSVPDVMQRIMSYKYSDSYQQTPVVLEVKTAHSIVKIIHDHVKKIALRQNVLYWQTGKASMYLRMKFADGGTNQDVQSMQNDVTISSQMIEFIKDNRSCSDEDKEPEAHVFIRYLFDQLGMYSNENDQFLIILRNIGKSAAILNKIAEILRCSYITFGYFEREAKKSMLNLLSDSSVPSALQKLVSAIADKHIAIQPDLMCRLDMIRTQLPNDDAEQEDVGIRFAQQNNSKAKLIIEEVVETIKNDLPSSTIFTEEPTVIDSEVIHDTLVGFGHKVMNVFNHGRNTDRQNRFLERFLSGLAIGYIESARHNNELQKVILNLQRLVSGEDTSPTQFGINAAFQHMTASDTQGTELLTLVNLINSGLLNLPDVVTTDTIDSSTLASESLPASENSWTSAMEDELFTAQTITNTPLTQISTTAPSVVVTTSTDQILWTISSTVAESTTITDYTTELIEESSTTAEHSTATSAGSRSTASPTASSERTSLEELTTMAEETTKPTEVASTTSRLPSTTSTHVPSTRSRTSSTNMAQSSSKASSERRTQSIEATLTTSTSPITTGTPILSTTPTTTSTSLRLTSPSANLKSKIVTTYEFTSTNSNGNYDVTNVPSKISGPLKIVVPFLKKSLGQEIKRGRSMSSMIKSLKKNDYLVTIVNDIFSLQVDVTDTTLSDIDRKVAVRYINAMIDQLEPYWANNKDTSNLIRNLVTDDKCLEHIAKSLKREHQRGGNHSVNAIATGRYNKLIHTPISKITDLLSTIADQFVNLPAKMIKSLTDLETTLITFQNTNAMSFQKIGRQLCKDQTSASQNVITAFKDAVSGIAKKGNKSTQLKIKRVVPNLLDLQSAITSFGKKLMAFQKKTTPNTYLNEVLLGLIQNALMENSLNSHLEDLQTAIDNIRNQNPSDIGWNAALNDVVNELAKQSDALLNHLNSGIGEMDKEEGNGPNWAAIVGICCAIIVVVVVVVLVVLYMRKKKVAEEELTMEPDDPDVSVRMLSITESRDPKSEETQSMTDVTQDTENLHTVPELDPVKNRTDQPKTQFISTQLETDSTGSADVTQGTQSSESDITQISVVGSPKIDQSQKFDLLKTQLSELTSGKSLRTNKSQRSDKEDMKSQMKSELIKSQIKSAFEQSKVVEKSKMEHLTQISQLSEIKENKSFRPNDNLKSGVASIHIRFD